MDNQDYVKLLPLLISKEDFDEDQDICGICKDLIRSPLLCQQCQSFFCSDCVSNLKPNKQGKKCCFKCKNQSNYQKTQPKGLLLSCPFSKQCKEQITPESLTLHAIQTQHTSEQIKQKYKKLLGNRCLKGHQLSLMVDTFKNLTSQQCNECKKVGLARNQCQECNVIFCVKCRPIPFKNRVCKAGHKLTHQVPKQSAPFLCDVCDVKKKNLTQIWVDTGCNIGVCPDCYENMEE